MSGQQYNQHTHTQAGILWVYILYDDGEHSCGASGFSGNEALELISVLAGEGEGGRGGGELMSWG